MKSMSVCLYFLSLFLDPKPIAMTTGLILFKLTQKTCILGKIVSTKSHLGNFYNEPSVWPKFYSSSTFKRSFVQIRTLDAFRNLNNGIGVWGATLTSQ